MQSETNATPETPVLRYRLGECTPAELLNRPELSARDKLAVLRQWEHDAHELLVAEEENMPGDDAVPLSDIRDAIRTLQTSPSEQVASVAEVMTVSVRTVHSDNRISDVARQMAQDGTGLALVLDGDSVAGVVTDRDIAVRAVASGMTPSARPVADIMTNRVVACRADATLPEAAELMARESVRRLCVVDKDGGLAGLVSISDLALGDGGNAMAGRILRAITRAPGTRPDAGGRTTSRHTETNRPGGLHVYDLRPRVPA